jgi:hypothetical protein
MFAIPGIVLLLAFLYTRPQEFIPELRAIPLLYVFLALAIFGWAVDLRLRRSRPVSVPQLPWVLGFYGWALFTVAIRRPDMALPLAIDLGIPIIVFVMLAMMVQSFRAFSVVAVSILALSIFLAAIGVHQGLAPWGCHRIDASSTDQVGIYDGRSCSGVSEKECEEGDVEPGADYACEKIGLFGTSSIAGGRVRYRGALNDPNELALVISVGLPFAFALFERKRNLWRFLLSFGGLALVATCVVFTQSRGGQLVLLAVLATYFVKRFGIKGLIYGAIVGAPVLLLGGRQGESADSSSIERVECMYAAIQMFKQYPFRGVGLGQILDYHTQTAHNSYALAAAELGFPGMVLWTGVLYVTIKIPYQMLRDFARKPETAVARAWAMAILSGSIGMAVGIFFLSFCYHQTFWIQIGMSAALYSACKAHDPDWEVRFGPRDWLLLVGIDSVLVVVIFLYTRAKVGG